MLPRVRPSVALLLLILLLAGGGAWLWRNLHLWGDAGDSGSPQLGSSRHAVEFLSKEAPPTPPADQPSTADSSASQRRQAGRDGSGRAPNSADSALASARLSGLVVDREGRGVRSAQIFLAPWIEDESDDELSRELDPFAALARSGPPPLVPARIAVHLPIDLADPASAGLPVPLRFRTDDAGLFAIELPPGRWRLLIRSTQSPYERNDLLLAASEKRDLGAIVLRPGVVYRLSLRDSDGKPAKDVDAAPIRTGLGAEFPPLGAALASPFLAPHSDEKDKENYASLPQRPIPFSLFLRTPQSRALTIPLTPSSTSLSLRFPAADHLHGGLETPGMATPGQFWIHARPLDFFAAPIPSEFRADLARTPLAGHPFDLSLPDRSETYELRAAFGDEPPLLDSPWSPPLFAATDVDETVRVQHSDLREPLLWRPDARVHFELSLAGWDLPDSQPEALLLGFHARGFPPGTPIPLGPRSDSLQGLRLLRGSQPELWLHAPGTETLSLPLPLVPGADADLGRLTLAALPAVPIEVTDARTGKPIASAAILTFEPELFRSPFPAPGQLVAQTDLRGHALSFSQGTPGSLLEIRAPTYAPTFLSPHDLSADGALHAQLVHGATVRVRVFDTDAAPLRGALVECTHADWTPDLDTPLLVDSQPTDAAGWATFSHIPPGEHAFRLHTPDRLHPLAPSEWSLIAIANDETRELTLSTRSRAQLRVRVSDASGPRPDVLVTLETSPLTFIDPPPLSADDPLPYGIDAWTDSRGELLFEDLTPASARLTFTLPDSPLRLRRALRLHSGPQLLTLDLSDTTPLDLSLPEPPLPLDLRLLPEPISLDLSTSRIPLASLDLEHTSRLDRRHGRPDLAFAASAPLLLPTELLQHHLLLTSPSLDLDLSPAEPITSSAHASPSLRPASTLGLTLLSLRRGERYVLALGRDPNSQLSSDALSDLPSDSSPSHLTLERTVPFVATAPSLTFTLTHLLPGDTRFVLYRLSPDRLTLQLSSSPQSITITAEHSARLRLAASD